MANSPKNSRILLVANTEGDTTCTFDNPHLGLIRPVTGTAKQILAPPDKTQLIYDTFSNEGHNWARVEPTVGEHLLTQCGEVLGWNITTNGWQVAYRGSALVNHPRAQAFFKRFRGWHQPRIVRIVANLRNPNICLGDPKHLVNVYLLDQPSSILLAKHPLLILNEDGREHIQRDVHLFLTHDGHLLAWRNIPGKRGHFEPFIQKMSRPHNP